MAHVITDKCTKCMSCSVICPVSCIHPAEGEAGLENVPQLYINPDECINCGVCIPECPVEAIFPEEDITADKKGSIQANADYYKA